MGWGLLVMMLAFLLAFANGANGNGKGVATLVGGRLISSAGAIRFAAVTTLMGSISSIWVGIEIARKFQGDGVVSVAMSESLAFPVCIAIAAGVTVLIATCFCMPISTTHAIVGAIVGMGLAGGDLVEGGLWNKFYYPLLLSPLLAVFFSSVLLGMAQSLCQAIGVVSRPYVCFDGTLLRVEEQADGTLFFVESGMPLSPQQQEKCIRRYDGKMLGMDAERLINRLHLFSAGAICFARGLNDTPKVAAMVLGCSALPCASCSMVVAFGILGGGLLLAHRVLQTMGREITPMNQGQAFGANFTTALLVIIASFCGCPVSTTHISCGSLFGIGLISMKGNRSVIISIIVSWVATLPVSACIGALCWMLFA